MAKKSDEPVLPADWRQSDDKDVLQTRRYTGGFKGVPECMYFHHIIPNKDDPSDPFVKRYYYTIPDEPIAYNELDDLVRKLTINARKDKIREQNPPPDGNSLRFNVWSRKSYVAFVIDDPKEAFDEKLPILLDYPDTGKVNHSFFDGWCRKVDMSASGNGRDRRSVLCFMNHMKEGPFEDLGRENDYMGFLLNIISGRGIRYPDSGGTNMGPPIGPP